MSKIVKFFVLTTLLTAATMGIILDADAQILSSQSLQKWINIDAGTIYYVDGASGSDSYPGTQSLPWKTIRKAAITLKGGDTAIVNAGTYNERVVINSSGSSGSLISFQAQGTVQCQGFTVKGNYIQVKGFKVTAIQPTWTAEGYGIWVEGANCVIENNFAYYCPTGGIVTTASSASCLIRNNRCQRNALNGIEINGVNHLIENNEIWATISYHTPTNWSPSGDANGIMYWGSGHIFRKNYIHDISYSDPENQGYLPHIDAFQTFADANHPGGATNVVFERNLVILTDYRDGGARCVAFTLRDASSITIRDNILIAFGGIETGGNGGTCHHLKLQNNTFVGNLTYPPSCWPIGISLENCPYSAVKNNIVYDQVNLAIYISGSTYTGLDIGYNCTYNSDGTNPFGTPQPHDLWGVNPKFVDAAGRNYHLQSSSPCINTGAALTDNAIDYDGNPRPIGNGWDIGAYEYTGPNPLSASANASPKSGAPPLTVNFAGSASGGTAPYTYKWNFGDGHTSTAQNPTHTYTATGNYTATLTVTDSASATADASADVSVGGNPPLSANIHALPTSGPAPLTVNFTGIGSGGTAPYTYSWNFGDSQSGIGQYVSHVYSAPGNYVAMLTIADSIGTEKTSSVTISVSLKNPNDPVALFSANPSQGLPPLQVNFDASASYDPDGSLTSYDWDFGDGTWGSGKITSHTFNKRGTFPVTLKVTDNSMRTAFSIKEIVVFSKPTALFTTLSLSDKTSWIQGFDASASYDPYGTIVAYKWFFGDGTSGSGMTIFHAFPKQGTYIVRLIVMNDQGYPSEVSKAISVPNKPRERKR
jgi:PKD repeat protein